MIEVTRGPRVYVSDGDAVWMPSVLMEIPEPMAQFEFPRCGFQPQNLMTGTSINGANVLSMGYENGIRPSNV